MERRRRMGLAWWLVGFVVLLVVAYVPLGNLAHREAARAARACPPGPEGAGCRSERPQPDGRLFRLGFGGLPLCGPEGLGVPCYSLGDAETLGTWLGESALATLRSASRSMWFASQQEHELELEALRDSGVAVRAVHEEHELELEAPRDSNHEAPRLRRPPGSRSNGTKRPAARPPRHEMPRHVGRINSVALNETITEMRGIHARRKRGHAAHVVGSLAHAASGGGVAADRVEKPEKPVAEYFGGGKWIRADGDDGSPEGGASALVEEVLPKGVEYAVHFDHAVAAQRSIVATFGNAGNLTRREENMISLKEIDAHLRKQAQARASKGVKARRKPKRYCEKIAKFWKASPAPDCEEHRYMADCKESGTRAARAKRGHGRVFGVSQRKDYEGFVSEELYEMGLCRSDFLENGTAISEKIGFYLGEQFESPAAPDAFWASHFNKHWADDAIVGAMPGLMRLFGTKQSYADFYWQCRDMARETHFRSGLCPKAWVLSFNVNGGPGKKKGQKRRHDPRLDSRHVERFKEVYADLRFHLKKNHLPMVFIVKPQKHTYLSRGMHLARLDAKHVETQRKFLAWVSENILDPSCKKKFDDIRCNRREVTFQQYIHKPSLVHGRKFDIRMWVLITSVDPLRVYIMRHAYPKIATRKYQHFKDLQDQCEHIRLLLDPYCNETVREFLVDYPDGYPKSTASPVFFEGLTFGDKHKTNDHLGATTWVSKESYWESTVWPSLELAFSSIMMLARGSLLRASKQAAADAERDAPPAARRKSGEARGREAKSGVRHFALLSPDLAVDTEGTAYIEEINTNGLIMGTHDRRGGYMDLFHDEDYMRDFLRIVGADDHPDQAVYGDRLDAALEAWCAPHDKGPDSTVGHDGPCTPEIEDAIKLTVHEEAHSGKHWYRLYPPIPCHAKRHGHICDTDHDGQWWPEQHRVTGEMRAAMRETDLDLAVRKFLVDVDTEAIHNHAQVPGHGRWYPRIYQNLYAP